MYHQRLPGHCLATGELAQRLGAISTELNQPVSVYVNRRGQVIRVGVGTPRQTQIPLLELPRYGAERLSGIRCITTSLSAEPPTESSLTAMALQRLDALIVLLVTGSGFMRRGGGMAGYVDSAYLANLLPQMSEEEAVTAHWQVTGPLGIEKISQESVLDLVESLEAEFQREFIARQVEAGQDRVLIVGLQTDSGPDLLFEEGLVELERLVDTAGGKVLEIVRQKRSSPHPQTVIGAGKVEEIALTVQTTRANLVVFNRDLSASQIRNLEVRLGVRVIDRTEVILDIFAQRAQSQAGKLQVELAQLEYMMPRLTGRGKAMSRLGGGIGTRGPGETKLETERRAIQKRITRLQQEVNQLQNHRARLRQKRQKQAIPSVAIVGYTNAGKSTLINALTQADVYIADQLFATLDPTTRRLTVLDSQGQLSQTLLLTDTVGFIHELPPALVDAFRATLEEVTEADALLQLVDLSHPAWKRQLESVDTILQQMPISTGPMLIAFNKIDQVSSEALAEAQQLYPQAVFISASKRLGLETLKQHLLRLVRL
ncbi:GTPase HflX [Synechocystis sp. LKSZ1]|uniref:GTPase HflX n=1 Tax=Synechocystis sp. LKSZ1 TaxID=3144951 RepID=UPI00336BE6E0